MHAQTSKCLKALSLSAAKATRKDPNACNARKVALRGLRARSAGTLGMALAGHSLSSDAQLEY